MYSIITEGIHKTYTSMLGRRSVCALDGVTIRVKTGEVYGLIGLNGAGKTTFIKSLLSIVRPQRGDVSVLGGSPDDPRIRARIGYLPERIELPGALTAYEFVRSVGRIKGLRDGDILTRRVLADLGLSATSRKRISKFSKGMRQRVGLGAALLGSPELLILDEPTDGIDPIGRTEIRQMLQTEKERGTTVFINSHLLSETERLADRIGIISNGKLATEDTLDNLCRQVGSWQVKIADREVETTMISNGFVQESPGEVWQYSTDDIDLLNDSLANVLKSGVRILSLNQSTLNLEDVLKNVLKKEVQ